jgi:uncharacterized protein (TIGR02757 family)
MRTKVFAANLCELYASYNRREFVHPDPLEFLYHYPDVRDREIVGLIASSLAYGNVRQILTSVRRVLVAMDSPRIFLKETSLAMLRKTFKDFKHRFTTGEELATMLYGVKRAMDRHGSLHASFLKGLADEHETIVPALTEFVRVLSSVFRSRPRSVLPSPEAGSACKRLNLYLRWMVRSDSVDPGGWNGVPPSKLVVPVDVHMHRIALRLGLTRRKQANLRTALEITTAFRAIEPDDPVKYDFALTRLGIRDDLNPEEFLRSCHMVNISRTKGFDS